jgi:NAD(P)-dependent dehydrogenase (short-subunit alcohol dehydrogenase family)
VQTSLDEWRRVIAVNLDGVFRGGAIVNVSSTAGLVGSRSMAPMARPKREC